MWDRSEWAQQRGSFLEAVPIPASAPDAGPQVCVTFSAAWLPYVVGALMQLMQPTTWIAPTAAAMEDVLYQAGDLLALVGTAGACMQAGSTPLTIPAGSATAAAAVVFPQSFASMPVVVASESSGLYIASVTDVTLTGCTLHATANVTLRMDGPTVVSWIAREAT